MFSVQRFDGSIDRGEGSTNGTRPLDRIALINQRKATRYEQNEPSTSKVTLSEAVTSTTPAVNSFQASAAPAPMIHPSRLAVSHTLRQADQKAKLLAKGGVKEKTKAKQRYLKTKKERRKKRKASGSKKEKKTEQAEEEHLPGSDDSESSTDDEADEQEARDDVPPVKKQRVEPVQPANLTGEDPDSDSSSSSPPSSSDSEDAPATDKEEPVESITERANNIDITTSQNGDEFTALSRFPAPKRTLQASRKDLAKQGLPSGLANPQRIDPTLTQSVKKSDRAELDQISPAMKVRLAKMGIHQWFAVQTSVIPLLLSHPQSRSLYPDPPLPDLCVSAPTGSGKTLSYSVPIVEVLSERICRQLRALIILPTRDLVDQVRETIVNISKGTSLSVAAITGQQSFLQEQGLLMNNVEQKRKISGMMPYLNSGQTSNDDRRIGGSKIDILIATPGRLIDHLNKTPGFTLQHLRFLVIDEADRLLDQSFQEWLPRVLDGLDPEKEQFPLKLSSQEREEHLAPAWQQRKRTVQLKEYQRSSLSGLQKKEVVGVQKLLFSATLTRDPAKILALQLRNAAFISVEDEDSRDQDQWGAGKNSFIDRQESFALPATLSEHMIVTKGEDKVLDLLYLLYGHEHRIRQALCFTKSVENAARLVKLIEFYQEAKGRGEREEDGVVVKEYSSDLNSTQRSRILRDFKANKIDVLICSDVMARGMDLPEVRHVISYDVPVDMAKYVHRVGRTARANRQGDAWTLVEEQEARHFKTMMKRGGRRSKIDKIKIKSDQRDVLQVYYDKALSQLESFYSR